MRGPHRRSGAGRPNDPPRLLLGIVLFLVWALLRPPSASAQPVGLSRFSVEPRVGVAFPTGDFGNIDPTCSPGGGSCPFPFQVGTETGWRWSVRGLAKVRPGLKVLAEYGKTNLGCSPSFCGATKRPRTQAVGLGLRAVAFPLGSMDVWLEGGGVLEETTIIRTRDTAGDLEVTAVSYPWSMGFTGGLGVELDLKGDGALFFTPGFRFRYVPADPPESDADLAAIKTTYMLFEVGFRFALGK